ncbi:type II secretion system F family protein, partial [bacterium]
EKTGRLPELLKRLADGMETDVDARLKALVAVIEPLMIVLMGTVVGGITVSIIGPIYSVVEHVK